MPARATRRNWPWSGRRLDYDPNLTHAERPYTDKRKQKTAAARERKAEVVSIRRETAADKKRIAVARTKYAAMMAKAKKARSVAVKSDAYDSVPSEAAILQAYKNGAGSLNEALAMAGAQKNPAYRGRAARTRKRSNLTDRAHRYRANRNKPKGAKRCIFCGRKRGSPIEVGHLDGHEENGNPSNLVWNCRSCNVVAANTLRAAGLGRSTNQYNPASKGATTLGEWMQAVGSITPHVDRGNRGLVSDMPVSDAVEIIQATSPAKRARFAAQLKGGRRRNPADEAAQGYEDFHGQPVQEYVTVTERIHTHSHLAAAGLLKRLDIAGVDGYNHTLTGFDGAFLAFNERRSQLFIKGGDQSVNLEDYGIDKPHELETLGEVVKIDYATDKKHLGDEGGKAVYRHKFRTTNEDGKHVTIRVARYPTLIYRTLEQRLELAGGSYEILPEGIDR